jgi:hypothetical protein
MFYKWKETEGEERIRRKGKKGGGRAGLYTTFTD